MFFSGLDFEQRRCDPAKTFFAGAPHVRRQTGFCAIDELSSADNCSSLRRGLRRRVQDQELFMSRAVSLSGVCAKATSKAKSQRF